VTLSANAAVWLPLQSSSDERVLTMAGIGDYAMIGDGRTAALVSRDGSIDWLCLPRFDSDACCAALLGTGQHGYWRIAPCGSAMPRRSYHGDTLVLETEFTGFSGGVRLTDFMVIGAAQAAVVRQVTGLYGTLRFRCELSLKFDYGLMPPLISRQEDALLAVAGPDLVKVRSPVPWEQTEDGMIAEFDVAAGCTLSFVLS
jgi:GH15 family glucan-1,4-alpha-glucosidase